MSYDEKLTKLGRLYEGKSAAIENFDHPVLGMARNQLGVILLNNLQTVSLGDDYIEVACGRTPALSNAADLLHMNQKPTFTLVEPRFAINYETADQARNNLLNATKFKPEVHLIPGTMQESLPDTVKNGATMVMFNALNYIEPHVVEAAMADPRLKAVVIGNGEHGYTEDKADGHYSLPSLRPLMHKLGFREYLHIITLSAEDYFDTDNLNLNDYRALQQYTVARNTPQFMVWLRPENQQELTNINNWRSVYGVVDCVPMVGQRKTNVPREGKLLYGQQLCMFNSTFDFDKVSA